MQNPQRILFWLVGGLVVFNITLGVAVFSTSSQPTYQGRTLTEWMDDYYSLSAPPTNSAMPLSGLVPFYQSAPEIKSSAHLAIYNLGTNATPWLVRWLEYEQPSWKRLWLSLTSYLGPTGKPKIDPAHVRAERARECLRILGPAAEPAVPRLSRLMNDTRATNAARRATLALLDLTQSSHSVLAAMALLTSSSPTVRSQAIGALSWAGPEIKPAIPQLIALLKDPDPNVASAAIAVLGNLKLEPATVIPALLESLADPRPTVRLKVIQEIRYFANDRAFGEQTIRAVPGLLKALEDEDKAVRQEATNTLRLVRAEALPKNKTPAEP